MSAAFYRLKVALELDQPVMFDMYEVRDLYTYILDLKLENKRLQDENGELIMGSVRQANESFHNMFLGVLAGAAVGSHKDDPENILDDPMAQIVLAAIKDREEKDNG